MKKWGRKSFLQKMALAGSAWLFRPELLNVRIFTSPMPDRYPVDIPGGFSFDPNDYGIVDLHCHPSLKMFLWGRKLWHHHSPHRGTNPIALQDDVEQLSSGSRKGEYGEGFVKGIIVAHYLVEASAEKEWNLLKSFFPLIKHLFRRLANKLEHQDWSNFTQINQIIDEMEAQVYLANYKQRKLPFVIARSYAEFDQAIKDKKFPVAHAIEGAHALGRNQPISANLHTPRKPQSGKMMANTKSDSDASSYIRNLEALKDRGVCLITLAHLFPNDIAFCVEGISPDAKKTIGMTWAYDNTDPLCNRPLTVIGEKVVTRMLELGMIIDLTHLTTKARTQVFKLNRERKERGEKMRPVVFTHCGAREIFFKYDNEQFPNFSFYDVSDGEIASICECNGTIGVIPEVFWLTGADTHLKDNGFDPADFRDGVKYMVETILYINSKTPEKDYRHITIGTDFDGFADAPQDLYKASQLGTLIQGLLSAGLHPDEVKRITSENALRVLKEGWG